MGRRHDQEHRPGHPLLSAIREQVQEAEGTLAKQQRRRTESTDDVNPVHQQLKLDYAQQQAVAAGLQARLLKLEEQERTVHADIRKLNGHEIKIAQLQREVTLVERNYFTYSESMEQARVDQELANERISNVNLVQRATLQEKPVSPSKVLVAVFGMLSGVTGSIGMLILAQKLAESRYAAARAEDWNNGHSDRPAPVAPSIARRATDA